MLTRLLCHGLTRSHQCSASSSSDERCAGCSTHFEVCDGTTYLVSKTPVPASAVERSPILANLAEGSQSSSIPFGRHATQLWMQHAGSWSDWICNGSEHESWRLTLQVLQVRHVWPGTPALTLRDDEHRCHATGKLAATFSTFSAIARSLDYAAQYRTDLGWAPMC
jgi:hypothetical protein